MDILFIHQNFPGQFKYLAPALAAQGHRVVAFSMQVKKAEVFRGVDVRPYRASRGSTAGIHPWVGDFETKTIRAEACFRAALALRDEGFSPEVIVAHPGWGESLFLSEVWPQARLGIYCEFYYRSSGADTGFDPEFPVADPLGDVCRLRLKNLNNLLHFEIADGGISPTQWQASTFPDAFRKRITVIHDGIDTAALAPDPAVSMRLAAQMGDPAGPVTTLTLTRNDPVLTFVNRNLEPYRGFHVFMRALPHILRENPRLRVLVVGGSDVSYGARPTASTTWRQQFVDEVRPDIPDHDWHRVHFLGNLPYPLFVQLLQLSTVHVYLTYPFVLSWSLLEAMSVGCAIVASDTAPLREALVHDQTGRLVDFFDFRALAQAVTQLLGDPDTRQRLGARAREFAQAHYDLHAVCLPRQLAWVQGLAGQTKSTFVPP